MLCLCEGVVVSVLACMSESETGPQHVLCAAVPIKYSQNINDGHLSRLSLSNYNFNLLFIIVFFIFSVWFLKDHHTESSRLDPTCVFTVTDCMRRS